MDRESLDATETMVIKAAIEAGSAMGSHGTTGEHAPYAFVPLPAKINMWTLGEGRAVDLGVLIMAALQGGCRQGDGVAVGKKGGGGGSVRSYAAGKNVQVGQRVRRYTRRKKGRGRRKG